MDHNHAETLNMTIMRETLKHHKKRMALNLKACAGCSLCAESCFLFELHDHDPHYMPSYKVLKSLGTLYRRKGRVTRAQLNDMAALVWQNCVLCGRCYCPFGIDIPAMIALARRIMREQNIDGLYPYSIGAPENKET